MKKTRMPRRMQRTWWQIVATLYTGFRLLQKEGDKIPYFFKFKHEAYIDGVK